MSHPDWHRLCQYECGQSRPPHCWGIDLPSSIPKAMQNPMGFTRDFSYRYIYNHTYIYNYIYIHIRIHRYVAGWYKGYLQKIHLSHVDVNPSVKMVVPKNGVHPPKMAMWIENMMKHQIWDFIWFHMFYLNVSSIEMLINLPCIIMYLVKHLDLTKWQNELHHPRTKWTSPGKSGPHQSLDLHFWVQTNVNV